MFTHLGLLFDKWLESQAEATQSPSVFIDWEALTENLKFTKDFNLPVYLATATDDKKWTLALGVGPKTVEIDRHCMYMLLAS